MATRAWMAWVVLYLVATLYLFFEAPWAFQGKLADPLAWLLFPGLLASLVALPLLSWRGADRGAFLASSVGLVAMTGLVGLSLYPRLVPALGHATDLDASLTIVNASSSPATLLVMLVITLVGMPLVLVYTALIFRVFRGKVAPDGDGY